MAELVIRDISDEWQEVPADLYCPKMLLSLKCRLSSRMHSRSFRELERRSQSGGFHGRFYLNPRHIFNLCSSLCDTGLGVFPQHLFG
jgi:hypothetical protein